MGIRNHSLLRQVGRCSCCDKYRIEDDDEELGSEVKDEGFVDGDGDGSQTTKKDMSSSSSSNDISEDNVLNVVVEEP